MSEYTIRKLTFHGAPRSILLQDINGPCPLIAIINVLSLRGLIQLPDSPVLTATQAIALVHSHCANLVAKSFESLSLADGDRANVLQNFDDLTDLLARIEIGLDLNPVLNDCFSFEFTREVALFDACDVRIAHGWIVDPQDQITAKAIGQMNYNEATTFCALHDDKVQQKKDQSINQNNPSGSQSIDQSVSPTNQSISRADAERASVIQAWLLSNPTQLTVHGLTSLCTSIAENEIFILLRNSHFNVVTKVDGELYLLVTDEGLVRSAPILAWNRMIDVDGSDVYCDQRFRVPSQTSIDQSINQQNSQLTANIHTHLVESQSRPTTPNPTSQQSMSNSPSFNQSINQSNVQPSYRPVQSIQSTNYHPQQQAGYQSNNQFQQPTYQQGYQYQQQPVNQPINQNLHPYYHQPAYKSISQSLDQSINQNYRPQYPIAQHSTSAPQQPAPSTQQQNGRQIKNVKSDKKRSGSCSIM